MSFNRPKFRAHQKAHQTVVTSERWFTKGEPFLGESFTVKKTVKRHGTLVSILSRAAKRETRATNDETADAYRRLRVKLKPCRPHRVAVHQLAPNAQEPSSGPR
jgi:hypothetical protein